MLAEKSNSEAMNGAYLQIVGDDSMYVSKSFLHP